MESGVNDVLFNQVLANENFIQVQSEKRGRAMPETDLLTGQTQLSFVQLHLIFEEYQKVSGHPIEQAIQQQFSGDTRDGSVYFGEKGGGGG